MWLSNVTLGSCRSYGKGGGMEQVAKIPISPTLRKLKPGEKATFPIEQCSSVTAIVSKFRKDLARIGWDVDIKSDTKEYTVTVFRTK